MMQSLIDATSHSICGNMKTNPKIEDSTEAFLAILAVAVSAIVQVSGASGLFTLWNVMVGTILLSILAMYRVPKRLNNWGVRAVAATWGLTITITLGVLLEVLYDLMRQEFSSLPARGESGEAPSMYFFVIWILVTLATYMVLRRQQRL